MPTPLIIIGAVGAVGALALLIVLFWNDYVALCRRHEEERRALNVAFCRYEALGTAIRAAEERVARGAGTVREWRPIYEAKLRHGQILSKLGCNHPLSVEFYQSIERTAYEGLSLIKRAFPDSTD